MADNFIAGPTNRLVFDLAVTADDVSGMAEKIGFLSGTLLQNADSDDEGPVDVAEDVVYAHCVSNVLTYDGGAEATWGAIAIGDLVYYDSTSEIDDPCVGDGTKKIRLTTSPLDDTGASNCVFGKVIGNADATATQNVAERVWIVQQKSCCGCSPV